jgi:hypothetical protein
LPGTAFCDPQEENMVTNADLRQKYASVEEMEDDFM